MAVRQIVGSGPGVEISIVHEPIDSVENLSILLSTANDMANGELGQRVIGSLGEPIVERARQYLVGNGNFVTGKLHDSIRSRVTDNGVEIYSDVSYAEYIEYGFTQRNGIFWGPSPFMSPAVADVAAQSQGYIGDELKREYQRRIWSMGGGTITASRVKSGRGGYRRGTYSGLNTSSKTTSGITPGLTKL